ncbi:MAG: hypothetical protein QMD14_03030 [Candidatus Aenigmarchaeota archaeon]|nr:hypothetical protein [Candidatus Aenigmarchaeota archaeon]
MRALSLKLIPDDVLVERLSHEMREKVLHYERIGSTPKKEPYEIKNELDTKYLNHVEKIVSDVGDFIGDFLPRFFSYERAGFDYVRKRQVEYLNRCELLVKVRVKTEQKERELSLSFDSPSYTYFPGVLRRIKGQHVYIYDHLNSKISFVIGDRENPKTSEYFVNNAMVELWHLALYPYLIEKLNRNLKVGAVKPPEQEVIRTLMLEDEILGDAFTLASFEEFKEKKKYNVSCMANTKEKILDKIRSIGIKRALKMVSKPEFFEV